MGEPTRRIDVITIFPAYFDALHVSLLGRARARGLVEIAVHDLREWAADRHRTVDDTPYGGGAGMVMLPDPWGAALDQLTGPDSVLVVPTPAGQPFDQAMAHGLARERHLVVACGRYEGIDQRVVDHYATQLAVRELSMGDYVLNGGEVAALAMIEAVARLIPGFVGNPASLVEESHETGLLEAPVYTKPASWRGLDVPAVLLSGNHAAISSWRGDQALRRTAARRPDLVHASAVADLGELRLAQPADAGELLTLQRACSIDAPALDPDPSSPVASETLDDVRSWMSGWTVLVLRRGGRLIAAVRARRTGERWQLDRLMVAPDLQGQGIGPRLLAIGEASAPAGAVTYEVVTGAEGGRVIRLCRRAGYRRVGSPAPGVLRMVKSATDFAGVGPVRHT